jgi:peptidoglycan/xylan/chitin deacetylase (PgdA/CDA1 family)
MTYKLPMDSVLNISLMQLIGGLLAPSGNKSKLVIFTYHRVLEKPDVLLEGEVDKKYFDWQISQLINWFNILPLAEAVSLLQNGRLPRRAAAITFDDGYADNYKNALPILSKWSVPATFFIATGFLDGGRMWNDTIIESIRLAKGRSIDLSDVGRGEFPLNSDQDRIVVVNKLISSLKYRSFEERNNSVEKLVSLVEKKLPDDLMMTTNQVVGLVEAGMEVGAHTVNHPILANISSKRAVSEIVESKHRLTEIISKNIVSFAYPNGRPGVDYQAEHVNAVSEAGFKQSVTTAWGYATKKTDPFQLPRLGFWGTSSFRFVMRMLKTYASNPGNLQC